MTQLHRNLLISLPNEAHYIRHTLNSVAAQPVRLAVWVVADDGSRGESFTILEEYSRGLSISVYCGGG